MKARPLGTGIYSRVLRHVFNHDRGEEAAGAECSWQQLIDVGWVDGWSMLRIPTRSKQHYALGKLWNLVEQNGRKAVGFLHRDKGVLFLLGRTRMRQRPKLVRSPLVFWFFKTFGQSLSLQFRITWTAPECLPSPRHSRLCWPWSPRLLSLLLYIYIYIFGVPFLGRARLAYTIIYPKSVVFCVFYWWPNAHRK